jgi:ATP-binding cassette, subfamily F, member 3
VALNEFEGTVMLVSHDRALLRAVCDEFWLIAKGAITPFDGDLDDYQKYLLEQAKEAKQERQQSAKKASQTSRQTSPQAASTLAYSKGKLEQMRKEWHGLELAMAALTKEKNQLETAKHSHRLSVLSQELSHLESEWLILGDTLESANA